MESAAGNPTDAVWLEGETCVLELTAAGGRETPTGEIHEAIWWAVDEGARMVIVDIRDLPETDPPLLTVLSSTAEKLRERQVELGVVIDANGPAL